MTDLQRLGAIVFSPKATFRDINRRPSWILPFVLLLLINLAISFVVYRVLVTDRNFEQIALTRAEWDARAAGTHKPASGLSEQIEAIRNQRNHWYSLPLFAVPVSLLGLSLVFYLILLLAKAGISFAKVFTAMCWSFVIYRGIGGVATIIALLVRGPDKFFPAVPESWSPTSLAHVVVRTSVSPNVYSAISKLDIFLVWWLAVLSVGFVTLSKNLSIAKAVVLVAAAEVLYLVINAAGWFAGTL